MSKGPGRVEQAVAAAFAAHPEVSFSILDLARLAFPDAIAFDSSHLVSVRRAAKKVAARCYWRLFTASRENYFGNCLNVKSLSDAFRRSLNRRASGWITPDWIAREVEATTAEAAGDMDRARAIRAEIEGGTVRR